MVKVYKPCISSSISISSYYFSFLLFSHFFLLSFFLLFFPFPLSLFFFSSSFFFFFFSSSSFFFSLFSFPLLFSPSLPTGIPCFLRAPLACSATFCSPGSSLEAHIPAFRLKSQIQSSKPSLKAQIPATRLKSVMRHK